MREDADVLVVGGGLAGISAALELRRAGRQVLLLEAKEALGGRVGRWQSPLGPLPIGPSSFSGRASEFWWLLEQLDLTADAVKLDPRTSARFLVRGGKLRAIKPNPVSLLTTGAFTWVERLALLKELLTTRPAPTPGEDESLEALLTRRFGPSLVRHVFAAIFNGVYAGDLSKLSAGTCAPALVEAEREAGSVLRGVFRAMKTPPANTRPGIFTVKGGLARIGEAAAARLPTRLGVRLERLEVGRGGVRAVGTRGDVGVEFSARHLVLATEADVASRLLQDPAPQTAALLATVDAAPMALVQWGEREAGDSRLPLGFGYLAAPVEQTFALGSMFVADLTGSAPRTFTTFVGGALQPARAALSDVELVSGVRADLERLTGGAVGDVAGVVRWPRAVVQPRPGHRGLVERLRASLAGQPIALAGSYLGGAAMKDAISAGVFAAQELCARAEQPQARAVA